MPAGPGLAHHSEEEEIMATRTELKAKTKADLEELAADADVEGRSSMSKAELVDALADDTDTDAEGGDEADETFRPVDRLLGSEAPDEPAEPKRPVEAGGIDPALEAARDATAKAEERPPRVRPQAAMIDERLVEVRTRTRQEDRRLRSATAPPPTG